MIVWFPEKSNNFKQSASNSRQFHQMTQLSVSGFTKGAFTSYLQQMLKEASRHIFPLKLYTLLWPTQRHPLTGPRPCSARCAGQLPHPTIDALKRTMFFPSGTKNSTKNSACSMPVMLMWLSMEGGCFPKAWGRAQCFLAGRERIQHSSSPTCSPALPIHKRELCSCKWIHCTHTSSLTQIPFQNPGSL